ncbi:CARDB domain-containing protein [Pyxidicoccus sp. 3LG]
MKKWSAGIRCATGLAVCMTAAACGESATQTSEEEVSLEAVSSALSPGVDFVVSSVTVVGAPIVERNQPFNATVRVCNQGSLPGEARVQLYLSEDNIITPYSGGPMVDWVAGSVDVQLAGGECQTKTAELRANVWVDGVHYLGAAADSWNEVLEDNENNNTRVGSRIAVGTGPDLVVSSVTSPNTARPGEQLTATVKLCNQGNAAGPASAELYLSEDAVITPPAPSNPSTDIPVGYVHLQSLAPGQCATERVPFSASVPSDGKYYLGAVANPHGGIYELFTDNNARTGTRLAVGMLPDFTLTAVSGPASARPGDVVGLSATVCNPGTQPGATTVQWYLSPDAVITPAVPPNTNPDLLLASANTQPLAPGQCQTVTATGHASGAPDTVQYVGAVVDPFSNTPELFEENNTRAGNRLGLGERPDFVVSSVTGPASAQPGTSFSASVRVCNQGTAPSPTHVELYLSQDSTITPPVQPGPGSDVFVGHAPIASLAAGECQTVTVAAQGMGAPEGTWYLGAVVDPFNGTPEFFEENNTRAGGRIGIGYRSDFVVSSVTGPTSIQPGQAFNLTAKVCNQGTMTERTDVELYLSQDSTITPSGVSPDFRVGFAPTDPLAPGQCQTLSISGQTFGLPEGAYYLGAVADPFNGTPEFLEDNNTRTGSRIGIGYRPDLVVSSITGPTSARPHAPVNATVTVCNQGTANSFAEVELYLSQDTVITPFTPANPGPDLRAGFAPVGPLAAGQCQTVTAPLHGGIPEGAWYLGAVVDPLNGTQEFIEDNNTRAGTRVTVQP